MPEYPAYPQVLWTPIASLPGGFLNGWSADVVNVPQIGLVTVAGVVLAIAKGLIKATAGGGGTAMFTLPSGYRPNASAGLGVNNYYYFSYAGEAAGTNTNTFLLEGAAAAWAVAGGYDGAGTAFTAGNCKDILLDYSWRVKS